MKQKNFARFFLTTIFLLAFIQSVSAGVSHPLPSKFELMKGESGRFKFQIQNLGRSDSVVCTATLEDESLLIVEFDDEEMVLEGDSRRYFFGTVSVPEDYSPESVSFNAESEDYTQNFCIQCNPESTAAGASIQIRSCNLPINVVIVEARTRENMLVSPKPRPEIPAGLYIGAALLVVIIFVGLMLKKKKQTLKKVKKKK